MSLPCPVNLPASSSVSPYSSDIPSELFYRNFVTGSSLAFGGTQGRKLNMGGRCPLTRTILNHPSRWNTKLMWPLLFLSIPLLSIYHAYPIPHISNPIAMFSLICALFRLLFHFPHTQPSRCLSFPPSFSPSLLLRCQSSFDLRILERTCILFKSISIEFLRISLWLICDQISLISYMCWKRMCIP